MPVLGLGHVNIVTRDLAGTKRFYKDLLGLVDAEHPPFGPGIVVNWLADEAGRPILHLQSYDPARHNDPDAPTTGSIDHVAFDCADFDAVLARCESLGVAARATAPIPGAGFRQIFVTDPNGVVLELNFAG